MFDGPRPTDAPHPDDAPGPDDAPRPVIGRSTLTIALVLAAIMPVGLLGPRIEATLHPVIADHRVAYRVVGDEIVLSTTGRKRRGCEGEYRASDLVRRGGDRARLYWRTGPRRVAEPGRFNLDNSAALPGGFVPPAHVETTLWYRCHSLWLTPYAYPIATVTAPAVGP